MYDLDSNSEFQGLMNLKTHKNSSKLTEKKTVKY